MNNHFGSGFSNFLYRLREKTVRFMYGRYGIDQLYFALIALWAILALVGRFTGIGIFVILAYIPLIWCIFRSFSKNVPARRHENNVFLRIWNPVKNWFKLQKDRLRNIKTARYRKCKKCGAVIKFPNKKGKHTAVCPRCHERFNVHIL